jgi:outer membrane receptor protein involved in Fe transport
MTTKHRKYLRPIPSLLSVALASCLALTAPAALAQSTSATLRGVVTADAAPAGAATITATNLANGYVSRATANADGTYILAGLQPGTYRIDVSAGGKTSSQTVTLAVGQTASLNLPVGAAAPSATLGAVVVQGVALQETKTSEIATYVSTRQIEALPQVSRNFLAFADTVPGVVFSTDANDGSTKLRGGAQSSNGVNVFIDGVGQKNYVLKGGITGQDSSRGNPFPQLAIAEYKVITSNYKAEYDQVSSAAITAVTKSGGNEFHGNVFYDYTDEGMRLPSLREKDNDEKIASSDEQYGIAVGGPIIKDRMHFFFSYEAKNIDSPREIRLGQNYTVDDLPSELAALANETTGAPFEEDLYFGKIDWVPSDNHLVELTAKYRSEDELTNIGNGPNTASYGTVKTGDETRVDLRWQYSAESWLNDAHITYEDASFGPRAATIGPGGIITDGFDAGRTIINIGGGRDYQDKGQQGWSIQDDITFYDIGGGAHKIKAGFKYKVVDINAFEQQPYNAQYFYNIDSSLTVPYQVQFGAVTGGGDRNITSSNKQFGIYVQDDWDVNDKLQLNLGVRWDYEQTPGYYDYETPAGLVSALRNWSNLHAPGVDYDIEDYISDGSNRDAFKGAFAPRFGFSYDLNADQRHVIFGGAGRSYDRNLWDYLALEQSKSTFPTYGFSFNVPGHPCTVGVNNCLAWDPKYYDQDNLEALVASNPNLGAEVNLMNNDLKTPYSDQFSLGMRNVFKLWGNDWNSSVTVSHVRSYDGIVFTLGNRYPGGTFRDPNCVGATWGCQPWGYPIPGYGTLIIADNGIETENNSLLVSLEKLYTESSRWGVTVAYTFNDASENRGNAYASDEHYLFDYPNLDGAQFMRSLGLARHRLVATGIIGTANGLMFSTKLTLSSPTPKEALNCYDAATWNNCFFDPFTPGNAIGYKQWDVAMQKEWNTFGDTKFRVRADIINVMNWYNFSDYETWRGGPNDPNPNFGRRNGNGTVSLPRTLKLTAGFSW